MGRQRLVHLLDAQPRQVLPRQRRSRHHPHSRGAPVHLARRRRNHPRARPRGQGEEDDRGCHRVPVQTLSAQEGVRARHPHHQAVEAVRARDHRLPAEQGLPAGGTPLRLRRADALQPRHRVWEHRCRPAGCVCARLQGELAALGRGGAEAGQRAGGRDGLPAHQGLREALLPLPHHGQHREAAQDAQDRRDARRQDVALPQRALPRRRARPHRAAPGGWPPAAGVHHRRHLRPRRAGREPRGPADGQRAAATRAALGGAQAALSTAPHPARVQLAAAHREQRHLRALSHRAGSGGCFRRP
mmetsp:Transcript_45647/g.97246  ORF Transcript_45647/g.97246 Transcript_45647/m.97246 type:complete len:301 (-) Transcript_45647:1703-2605(-)